MPTARKIVTDALTDLGVLQVGETPSADDAAACLSKLNRMLGTWAARGLVVPQFGTLDSNLTLAVGYEPAITSNLMVEISPMFAKSMTPELAESARRAISAVISRASHAPPLSKDGGLQSPGIYRQGYWDWRTGQ